MHLFKKFNFTSGFRKILANTGYLFGEKAFNMGLSFVVSVWVVRYLGPNDFGLWQYAQSLVAIFSSLAWVGTNPITIRELVDQPEKEEGKILGSSFILMLMGGVVTAISTIILGFYFNEDALTRWLIIIASFQLILQAFNVFDYWFQSKVLSKYSVYARTTGKIVASVLKVVFILLSLSVIYFAVTVIIAGIIKITVWVYNYEQQNKEISNWDFSFGYAKELLKDGWPLIISGLSVAIYMKIDQVMLKSMLNSNAVGNYAAAVRVSELWYMIPVTLSTSVFPAIIKYKKENIEKYHRRLQYLYDIMAASSIGVAIVLTFLSKPLILILFGEEYASASSVLAIHTWASVFMFLSVARSKWIINENLQKYELVFTSTGALLNIVLNLGLIPILGIIGAAWATVISYMVSGWIMAYFFKATKVSFYMQGKAIINAIFIWNLLDSIKKLYSISIKN